MPSVEFEPTISAGERPHTYALERAANAWHVSNHFRNLNLFFYWDQFQNYVLIS